MESSNPLREMDTLDIAKALIVLGLFWSYWTQHGRYDEKRIIAGGTVLTVENVKTGGIGGASVVAAATNMISRKLLMFTPTMFVDFYEAVKTEAAVGEDGTPDITIFTNGKFFEHHERVFEFCENLGDQWLAKKYAYGASCGIHEGTTYGYGAIDDNGFWLFSVNPERLG